MSRRVNNCEVELPAGRLPASVARLGFTRARFLDGGLSAWSAAGLPLSAKQ